jgi:hypothetical protein
MGPAGQAGFAPTVLFAPVPGFAFWDFRAVTTDRFIDLMNFLIDFSRKAANIMQLYR